MKIPKKNGNWFSGLLSETIVKLWLWDMNRQQKRTTKETERQMKKRGLTYQELMQDEDYINELIAKQNKRKQ